LEWIATGSPRRDVSLACLGRAAHARGAEPSTVQRENWPPETAPSPSGLIVTHISFAEDRDTTRQRTIPNTPSRSTVCLIRGTGGMACSWKEKFTTEAQRAQRTASKNSPMARWPPPWRSLSHGSSDRPFGPHVQTHTPSGSVLYFAPRLNRRMAAEELFVSLRGRSPARRQRGSERPPAPPLPRTHLRVLAPSREKAVQRSMGSFPMPFSVPSVPLW